MTQKAFLLDLGRCIGCNACVISCKELRGLADSVHRRVVYDLPEDLNKSKLRNYLSGACNQCDTPACAANCPAGAYTKNSEGIVVHNKEVCIGCKMCAWSCPYHAPCYDEDAHVMDKCDMCISRLDEGKEPFCVVSCPLSAIKVCDVSEIPEGYQRGVAGYPDVSLTGANIYVLLPKNVDQVRR